MRSEGLSYEDARESVQSIRSVVQPNTGFSHQLMWYGRNGCPAHLLDETDRKHYSQLPAFARLLRRYSKSDVLALVCAAGAKDDQCKDGKALQRALDALDRLQNAMPLDEEARLEKRSQSH